jgi:hypothetical protein
MGHFPFGSSLILSRRNRVTPGSTKEGAGRAILVKPVFNTAVAAAFLDTPCSTPFASIRVIPFENSFLLISITLKNPADPAAPHAIKEFTRGRSPPLIFLILDYKPLLSPIAITTDMPTADK